MSRRRVFFYSSLITHCSSLSFLWWLELRRAGSCVYHLVKGCTWRKPFTLRAALAGGKMSESKRSIPEMAATLVPQGPRGHFILGIMPEFNRDSLAFIEKMAREYGDVVRTRYFYVPAYFVYHPDYIEEVLVTDSKNFIKPLSFRTPFFQRL